MSMESDLFTLLQTVCPRVFPDFAPTTTPRPYVTYQAIGGDSLNYVDNAAPDARNTTVQVNVWSNTRKEATALIRQIEDAMRVSALFSARAVSEPMHDFDADMPVYGCSQDFTIWAPR